MPQASRLDRDLLQRFRVSGEQFIARTERAKIWKVRRHNGEPAALKVYREDMDDEAPGFDLLAFWSGRASALLYERNAQAVLLEWLEGPSLGTRARRGDSEAADAILVETARRLHATEPIAPSSLWRLDDCCESLFTLEIAAHCPKQTKSEMGRCRDLARQLLAEPQQAIPLHGDLHHDNIRSGPRGYCAFYAKGLLGEPAYELVNAFRNPDGLGDLLLDPEWQGRRATLWSAAFEGAPRRLRQWAAVHSALSITWGSRAALEHHPDFSLLTALAVEAGQGQVRKKSLAVSELARETVSIRAAMSRAPSPSKSPIQLVQAGVATRLGVARQLVHLRAAEEPVVTALPTEVVVVLAAEGSHRGDRRRRGPTAGHRR